MTITLHSNMKNLVTGDITVNFHVTRPITFDTMVVSRKELVVPAGIEAVVEIFLWDVTEGNPPNMNISYAKFFNAQQINGPHDTNELFDQSWLNGKTPREITLEPGHAYRVLLHAEAVEGTFTSSTILEYGNIRLEAEGTITGGGGSQIGYSWYQYLLVIIAIVLFILILLGLYRGRKERGGGSRD